MPIPDRASRRVQTMRATLTRKIQVASVVMILVAACGDGEGQITTTTTDDSVSETAAAVTTTSEAGQGEAPDPSGAYLVTNYANPSNAVTNLWPDSEITLVLGGDGTISGNAGCNDYNGTYEVSGPYVEDPGFDEDEGQAFTINDLSWTEMACEDDLIMEQETEYLNALQNVDHWFFGQGFGDDTDALLLTSLEDGLQVQASAAG